MQRKSRISRITQVIARAMNIFFRYLISACLWVVLCSIILLLSYSSSSISDSVRLTCSVLPTSLRLTVDDTSRFFISKTEVVEPRRPVSWKIVRFLSRLASYSNVRFSSSGGASCFFEKFTISISILFNSWTSSGFAAVTCRANPDYSFSMRGSLFG